MKTWNWFTGALFVTLLYGTSSGFCAPQAPAVPAPGNMAQGNAANAAGVAAPSVQFLSTQLQQLENRLDRLLMLMAQRPTNRVGTSYIARYHHYRPRYRSGWGSYFPSYRVSNFSNFNRSGHRHAATHRGHHRHMVASNKGRTHHRSMHARTGKVHKGKSHARTHVAHRGHHSRGGKSHRMVASAHHHSHRGGGHHARHGGHHKR